MATNRLAELLAKAKARSTTPSVAPAPQPAPTEASPVNAGLSGIDKYGNRITYNTQQNRFIELVLSGQSCVLIGAAGTGKTTSTTGAISALLQAIYFPPMGDNHTYLSSQSVGIVGVSYTRRAVQNLRKAMPPDIKDNCITINKLLEYRPNFYEVYDPVSGESKRTMRFEPSRSTLNPLSYAIRTIIIDESGTVAVSLFHEIWKALPFPQNVQFIFLGDIQQLPPVFGSAILGYRMLSLPVVELTEVYRQALESPIIRLAHRILSGVPIPAEEYAEWNVPDQLRLHPWKKRIAAESALLTVATFFKNAYDSGAYTPSADMILLPFNKACGTVELNKHIANHIARRNSQITHEVIAGYNSLYFSVGDKVLCEKEDAVITDIKINPVYLGKMPQAPSPLLDYWGTLQTSPDGELAHTEILTQSEQDIDAMLEQLGAEGAEGRTTQASHIVTVRLLDTGTILELKTAQELNALLLAYSLTIHKSIGSEWNNVFLILHHSHNTMLQRELLYTACTRAKTSLYCICEPDSFTKGIVGQRIKGNTLAEKSVFFQGKLERGEEGLLAEMSSHQPTNQPTN